jgi:hypothetical protein
VLGVTNKKNHFGVAAISSNKSKRDGNFLPFLSFATAILLPATLVDYRFQQQFW